MKTLVLALALSLASFTTKPPVTLTPIKLETGLYKLEDTGPNKLTLGDKVYYTWAKYICSIKNFKSVDTATSKFKKGGYELNAHLDKEGTANLKEATAYIPNGGKKYIGLVIDGKLVLVGINIVPITNGKFTISDTSKTHVELIKSQLKAEMN